MVAASAEAPGLSGRVSRSLPMASGLAVLLLVFGLAYRPSIEWIIGEWTGSNGVMSHGYLIVAISAYLFVRALPNAAAERPKPFWIALPVVVIFSIIWLLGHVAAVAAVHTVILPLILLASIVLVFGWPATRHFAFSVLFLYFAMPAVSHLQFVFQEITIVAVHAMIDLVDIAAWVDGKYVFVPQGTFVIESGCSGLNFVVSGVALATLYSYLYYRNWRDTARLILLVLLVSMVGNWIRVFIIINIGYFFGMDFGLVGDHLWLGWVIFAILMVPVFFLIGRLESIDAQASDVPDRNPVHERSVRQLPVPALITGLLALSAAPAWAAAIASSPVEVESVSMILPADVDGWTGPERTVWDWQPTYIGATAAELAEYRQGDVRALVYSNVYIDQSQGGELIFFKNDIAGKWRHTSAHGNGEVVEIGDSGAFQVTIAESPYGSWVILHRNIIGGRPVIGDLRGKFQQSLSTLQGQPEAGVIAFAMHCAASCEEARRTIARFISAAGNSATIRFEFEGTE